MYNIPKLFDARTPQLERKMSLQTKSPVHPSALRLRDVTPGRHVALFSTVKGILNTITITERPSIVTRDMLGVQTRTILIVGNCDKGEVTYFATDCGVVPYYGPSFNWNPYNFLIDVHKLHAVPELQAAFATGTDRVTNGFYDSYAAWASD